MNRDVVGGKWKQLRGKIREKWGELTDDDLDRVQGKSEQLIGLLEEKYGYARDRAKREVDALFSELDGG
jgi:uncharacterized protein YjbJ (UPF0337 family)